VSQAQTVALRQQLIEEEIEALLQKQAVIKTTSSQGQFMSRVFLVKKEDSLLSSDQSETTQLLPSEAPLQDGGNWHAKRPLIGCAPLT